MEPILLQELAMALHLNMFRCTALKCLFSFAVSVQVPEHHSMLFDTLALNNNSLFFKLDSLRFNNGHSS